jgi:nicotinate-nucleotide pyrophosphorylase (carboxylating)
MKTSVSSRESMIETHPCLERVIQSALEEDLGPGDVTTDTIVDRTARGWASLVAREELVLAGLGVFKKTFRLLHPDFEFREYFGDGDLIPAGVVITAIDGPFSFLLKGERTALNFLQRLCGIATTTRRFVTKVSPYHVKVLDTRKTTPGLRFLEKYAVRMGGGHNHRFGLFDGILIKDNHIKAAGSIQGAIVLARANTPHTLKIEVETECLAEVEEALSAGADAILLDNMTAEQMQKAVDFVKGRVLLEASGGIDLETVETVAKTGVDLISIGALTHSAPSADLSLEIISNRPVENRRTK